jgi:hypothetical protein
MAGITAAWVVSWGKRQADQKMQEEELKDEVSVGSFVRLWHMLGI